MNFRDNKPIYMQLMDKIKEEIINDELKPGEKLLSIREYAEKTMVNPNTVQKAYSELENNNLVFTKRGIGYFVNEDTKYVEVQKSKYINKKIDEFLEEMNKLDYPKEKLIKKIQEKL